MATTTDANPATATLQGRARRLRRQAVSLHPLLADTYRRRATELDVQAWLEATWNPPIDLRHTVDPPDSRREGRAPLRLVEMGWDQPKCGV